MTVDTPAWARDAVFYQVFPDRFALSPRVPKPGPLQPWGALPTYFGYQGGDLLGLASRIGELAELGITGLYLNPIFTAASNHRYNAYDFLAVDPILGGEAALRELLDTAHDHGIRVVLDGVFNHVGRGFWPFHHVLESGGASPYRDWFYLDDAVLAGERGLDAYPDGGPRRPPRARLGRPGYRSWWDTRSLPKLRIEHPPVREHLLGVAEHWIRFGIDGWRLDVPEDVEDETFWPAFRERVRSVNPEAYLVGEIWNEAPAWLRGDRFDALMNYPLGVAILGFVGGPALDRAVVRSQSNYARTVRPKSGAAFGAAVERQTTLYDPAVTAVQFNLIGSHDTPRARTVLGGSAERLRLAQLLLLTLPGAPSIYYGDELAMEGGADPDCRRAYPVEPAEVLGGEAATTRAFVRTLIAARREHVALRRGTVRTLVARGQAVALEREADGKRAIVAVNAGDGPAMLAVPGVSGLRALDLGAGVGPGAPEGGDRVRLPARAALVLVE